MPWAFCFCCEALLWPLFAFFVDGRSNSICFSSLDIFDANGFVCALVLFEIRSEMVVASRLGWSSSSICAASVASAANVSVANFLSAVLRSLAVTAVRYLFQDWTKTASTSLEMLDTSDSYVGIAVGTF